jgi:hypothetical protein
MASKPSIPKEPEIFHLLRWQKTVYYSNYKKVILKFGFQPIETPSFELRNNG